MPRNDMLLMVASRESTCSDAHVAIETRREWRRKRKGIRESGGKSIADVEERKAMRMRRGRIFG